jgi:hypothetical protein
MNKLVFSKMRMMMKFDKGEKQSKILFLISIK